MENYQDILNFIYCNTQAGINQVSQLKDRLDEGHFKTYLQTLIEKYAHIKHMADDWLLQNDLDLHDLSTVQKVVSYLQTCFKTMGDDETDFAETLMQSSVMGIVQIKKKVRYAKNNNIPHPIYQLLLDLLEVEQFNLRCLQAFL